MAEIIENLVITHGKGVLINGEEVPWFIAAEPINTTTDPDNGLSVVYLPVFAKNVVIDDGT